MHHELMVLQDREKFLVTIARRRNPRFLLEPRSEVELRDLEGR
jgi:hypothetical protein